MDKGVLSRVVTHREFLKMCGLAVVGAGASQVLVQPQPVLALDGNFDNLYVNQPGTAGQGTVTVKKVFNDGSSASIAVEITTVDEFGDTVVKLSGGSGIAGGSKFIHATAGDNPPADRFYIKGDGSAYFRQNVGINTTTPTEKLTVAGSIDIVSSGSLKVNGSTAINSSGVATKAFYA